MATWPASLPQTPQLSGYSETPQSQTLRSSMDAGPAKVRRRFTAASRDIPVQYILSTTQRETFENWFDADIAAGALAFDWPHDGATVEARIRDGYSLTPLGRGRWQLSMDIEVLP